jgi:hypothetical protein
MPFPCRPVAERERDDFLARQFRAEESFTVAGQRAEVAPPTRHQPKLSGTGMPVEGRRYCALHSLQRTATR